MGCPLNSQPSRYAISDEVSLKEAGAKLTAFYASEENHESSDRIIVVGKPNG